MKNLNPYFDFGGKCREALEFYKQCFKGEIVTLMTNADAKIDVPAAAANSILHSEFKAEGIHFMASDGRPDQPAKVGTNIMLSISFTDVKEQEAIYNALAAGGSADLPLHDAFWGARFGMLTDRFGIHWMLNCEKK